MNKKNKFIFPNLVKGKEDILGMIAYSFYKLEKKDFINDYEITSGNKISTEELIKFQENKYQNLENYKKEAEHVLRNVVLRTIESQNKEFIELDKKLKEQIQDIDSKNKKLSLKEKEINKQKKELEKQEKELKKRNQTCKVQKNGFWYGVWQSLLATFVWTFLVVVIVLSLENDIVSFLLEKFK